MHDDALALVAAGKAEIGMYYQQDVIQAVANQGTGIKSIGAIVQSPLNVILSLKDKNITKPFRHNRWSYQPDLPV